MKKYFNEGLLPDEYVEEGFRRLLEIRKGTIGEAFYNLVTIFKNIFIYCYDEELIQENTYLRATYKKDLLDDYTKPEDETQVFTKDELEKIIELAYKKFKENFSKIF